MPVLTCPFATIPATTGGSVFEYEYPGVTLSTELTIKPVADETWDIEGLTIQFSSQVVGGYTVNVSVAQASLTKQKTALENQKTAASKAKGVLGEQLTHANAAAAAAEKVLVGAGKTEKENDEAKLGVENAIIAARGIEREKELAVETEEGLARELAKVEGEIKTLGEQTSREGGDTPPLTFVASAYARGNELVWTQELSPLRQISNIVFFPGIESVETHRFWQEHETTYQQFNDPVNIGERENLRLTIQIVGPPALTGEQGPNLVTAPEVSPVQAVVSYSRKVPGE